jgi:hypothetical protein
MAEVVMDPSRLLQNKKILPGVAGSIAAYLATLGQRVIGRAQDCRSRRLLRQSRPEASRRSRAHGNGCPRRSTDMRHD